MYRLYGHTMDGDFDFVGSPGSLLLSIAAALDDGAVFFDLFIEDPEGTILFAL